MFCRYLHLSIRSGIELKRNTFTVDPQLNLKKAEKDLPSDPLLPYSDRRGTPPTHWRWTTYSFPRPRCAPHFVPVRSGLVSSHAGSRQKKTGQRLWRRPVFLGLPFVYSFGESLGSGVRYRLRRIAGPGLLYCSQNSGQYLS